MANGNVLSVKDETGVMMDIVIEGDIASVYFSDELPGSDGEAFTIYFKKAAK